MSSGPCRSRQFGVGRHSFQPQTYGWASAARSVLGLRTDEPVGARVGARTQCRSAVGAAKPDLPEPKAHRLCRCRSCRRAVRCRAPSPLALPATPRSWPPRVSGASAKNASHGALAGFATGSAVGVTDTGACGCSGQSWPDAETTPSRPGGSCCPCRRLRSREACLLECSPVSNSCRRCPHDDRAGRLPRDYRRCRSCRSGRAVTPFVHVTSGKKAPRPHHSRCTAARAPNTSGQAVTGRHPCSRSGVIRSTVCFAASTHTQTEFSAGRARETGSFSRERVARDVRRE